MMGFDKERPTEEPTQPGYKEDIHEIRGPGDKKGVVDRTPTTPFEINRTPQSPTPETRT